MPSPKPSNAPKNADADTAPLDPGFYVHTADGLQSGPYLTADDAQSFIVGHLTDKATINEVTASE